MSIIARDDDFPIFMVGTNSPAKRTLLFRRVLGHTVLNQFEILLKEDDFKSDHYPNIIWFKCSKRR